MNIKQGTIFPLNVMQNSWARRAVRRRQGRGCKWGNRLRVELTFCSNPGSVGNSPPISVLLLHLPGLTLLFLSLHTLQVTSSLPPYLPPFFLPFLASFLLQSVKVHHGTKASALPSASTEQRRDLHQLDLCSPLTPLSFFNTARLSFSLFFWIRRENIAEERK